MKVDLDKTGLISLVMGTTPNRTLFDDPGVNRFGWFNGSTDAWTWLIMLKTLSETELYELYLKCRESWE